MSLGLESGISLLSSEIHQPKIRSLGVSERWRGIIFEPVALKRARRRGQFYASILEKPKSGTSDQKEKIAA